MFVRREKSGEKTSSSRKFHVCHENVVLGTNRWCGCEPDLKWRGWPGWNGLVDGGAAGALIW